MMWKDIGDIESKKTNKIVDDVEQIRSVLCTKSNVNIDIFMVI